MKSSSSLQLLLGYPVSIFRLTVSRFHQQIEDLIQPVLINMWFPWQKGPSGFSARSTAIDVTQGIDASGLIAIITGASSGIGAETARVLAMRGVHVIIAVRNVDTGNKVKGDILQQIPNAKIQVMELDLSSLASVRKFASNFNSLALPLNILVNNAGIMGTPFALSADGIEMQFATNHIGHFLLTNLLLDNMKNTARNCNKEGRIVNVSSIGHKFAYKGNDFDQISDKSSYNAMYSYGVSKLANILHAKELAKRLKEGEVNITINFLHPGVIVTNLVRHYKYLNGLFQTVGKFFFKTVEQGAATQCYLALNPQVEGVSGEYFSDSNLAKPYDVCYNVDLAKKLWEFSLNLTDSK